MNEWDFVEDQYYEIGIVDEGGEEKLAGPMEVTLTVRYRGYFDEGRKYGPVEKCYPPEGDDERIIERIRILDVPVPPGSKLFDILAYAFQAAVDDGDLPDIP